MERAYLKWAAKFITRTALMHFVESLLRIISNGVEMIFEFKNSALCYLLIVHLCQATQTPRIDLFSQLPNHCSIALPPSTHLSGKNSPSCFQQLPSLYLTPLQLLVQVPFWVRPSVSACSFDTDEDDSATAASASRSLALEFVSPHEI
jgi:hypothetical protein